MSKKKTVNEILKMCAEVHGNKYEYDASTIDGMSTPMKIICHEKDAFGMEHGEFWQTPSKHTERKQGCPKCAKNYSYTTEEIINKFKNSRGDKYDYSKVEYANMHTKVCIICPEHGEFWQTPHNHLKGQECPMCTKNKESKKDVNHYFINDEEKKTKFIEAAVVIHGDRYDYSKVEYLTNNIPVIITCKNHGEFAQTPSKHLSGHGCPQCGIDRTRRDFSEIVEEFNAVHHNFYDYSEAEYKTFHEKIAIICPVHGRFEQSVSAHLQGQGCPKCNSSHLEIEIRNFLTDNSIDFNEQQHFEWLGKQSLDFYIPSKNIAIECQGIQHFESVEHFGGDENLQVILERDLTKKELCQENNIKLLYYSNLGIDYPYEVIEDKNILLETINKN